MAKAFKTSFPSEDPDHDTELDSEDLWSSTADDNEIERLTNRTRLQCFAHTLQLTVGDGLKELRSISGALSKCSKLCTMLHTSVKFKEAFEAEFGSQRSIPADVCTRWNSKFLQVSAILKLSFEKLKCVVSATDQYTLQLSPREWAQLEELTAILNPFYEATILCQQEKTVSITMVVPAVVSLYKHTQSYSDKAKYLNRLSTYLRDSLITRFQGTWYLVYSHGHTILNESNEKLVT